MKEKTIEFIKGLGTIYIYIFLIVFCNTIFKDFYRNSNIIIATIAQLIPYIIILVILSLIYHKKLIKDAKNFKKDYITIALRNWIMGVGIMIISNIIIQTFIKDISATESINRKLLLKYPVSNIISMIFMGPLIEEITFRLSFKKAFSKWYTFSFVTALIFGLAHISNFKLLEFLFIIPYGALGFFFAKSLYETDNVYTSFIAHSFHNALCVAIILLI